LHLDSLSGKEKLKGDCFEELTELYLKLLPRYATIINNVWILRREDAGRIKRKLSHFNVGIDLVAKSKDGGYWTTQRKYLSAPDQSLGLKELTTFTGLALNDL